MAIMKAGVAGAGSMGRNHARIYSLLQGVELVGKTGGTRTGIFINSQQPNFYIGEKDMALMCGKFQPDDDVTQPSFL
jgi:hypothetical protein